MCVCVAKFSGRGASVLAFFGERTALVVVCVVGTAHYRDSIYCNPFTAKRDSENISDCKTRHVT
jgi:hypothetical protein